MAKTKPDGTDQTALFPDYHPPQSNSGDFEESPNLTEGTYQVTDVNVTNSSKFGEIVIVTLRDGSKMHTTSQIAGPQLKDMKTAGRLPATITVVKPAGKRYYTLK